jgi:spermidine synthase
MDALDPNDDIEFASGLYNSSSFEQSLMNALSDDGVFVTQLGQLKLELTTSIYIVANFQNRAKSIP